MGEGFRMRQTIMKKEFKSLIVTLILLLTANIIFAQDPREPEIRRLENLEREAILNDSHRKELFKALFDLYANAMPIVLKKDNGTVVCSYSDEVEQFAEKIREQIRLRDNQVFEAHS